METASNELDHLEYLWRVLGRIIEMTTGDIAWSQLFGIGNFDEDNEAARAQDPLWRTPRHHRYRLLMFHPRHLNPKHFRPSPEEWMATMRHAADGLVVLHEQYKSPTAIPPQDKLVHKLTLSKGMRDVWRAIDELTVRDLPRQAKRFTNRRIVPSQPKPVPKVAPLPPTPKPAPPPPPKPTSAPEKPARAEVKPTACHPKTPREKSDGARMCRYCGDRIPFPVMRVNGIYACHHCMGEHGTLPKVTLDAGARADMSYHGGRFLQGEW